MFRYKEKSIHFNNLKRTLILKYKYYNRLNKYLFHNRYLIKKVRIYYYYKNNLQKNNIKNIKNICNLSGGFCSVNKKLLFSRFFINYLSIKNQLHNFKTNSW